MKVCLNLGTDTSHSNYSFVIYSLISLLVCLQVKANNNKKKAKRKSMEGLEEGECSSDSPTEDDGIAPSPAVEVDSLSYEEQLRQRITSRLLLRRSEGETSPKEDCAPPSPASSLSSVGDGPPGDDLNRSVSAANATSSGDDEEVTEESLWDMDYAQHLRRKGEDNLGLDFDSSRRKS